MDTICGHDRETLKWALGVHAHCTTRDSARIAADYSSGKAYLDVGYPAKLVEMLAERGRQLGMCCTVLADHEAFDDCGADLALKATANHIVLDHIPTMRTKYDVIAWLYDGPRILELPQARTLLAAWLALPDSDRDGAEKALRGAK